MLISLILAACRNKDDNLQFDTAAPADDSLALVSLDFELLDKNSQTIALWQNHNITNTLGSDLSAYCEVASTSEICELPAEPLTLISDDRDIADLDLSLAEPNNNSHLLFSHEASSSFYLSLAELALGDASVTNQSATLTMISLDEDLAVYETAVAVNQGSDLFDFLVEAGLVEESFTDPTYNLVVTATWQVSAAHFVTD